MADVSITRSQVEALGARLDSIDFTDEERAILNAVFRAASGEPDVEPFVLSQPLSLSFLRAFETVKTKVKFKDLTVTKYVDKSSP